MSTHAVLIDSTHAKVFTFSGGEVTHKQLERHEPEHHTVHSQDHAKNSEHFFHQVAAELRGATHLLLLGHGLGKEHFMHHLEKHHHADLAKVVLAVETVDHPTDPQVVAHARAVFTKHHLAV